MTIHLHMSLKTLYHLDMVLDVVFWVFFIWKLYVSDLIENIIWIF